MKQYRIEIWFDQLGGRYSGPRVEHAATFEEAQDIADSRPESRIIRVSDGAVWYPGPDGGEWSPA